MLYSIGSTVKLAMYTGDDQIDHYYGQTLTVSEYHEIEAIWDKFLFSDDNKTFTIPDYTLTTPDGFEITANEYELEAV